MGASGIRPHWPHAADHFALGRHSGWRDFVALVVMSIVSIVGRKLASAPVPGDVAHTAMTAAFASALFFAYCHIRNGAM